MSAPTTSASASEPQAAPATHQPEPVSVLGNGSAVTEDEAALYDRQIRLWGLAAQNRLRSAHILLIGWNGIATEIIKNTVLSGIGSVTILDPTTVDGSVDLLSGFFFRDTDVGQLKCSQLPLDRVRALNPLVKVYGISDVHTYTALLQGGQAAEAWLRARGVDVVVAGTPLPATEGVVRVQEQLAKLNGTARAVGSKFFMSATLGLGGFYFADQIEHDYLVERKLPPVPSTSSSSTTTTAPTPTPAEPKRIKRRQNFVPLSASLGATWTDATPRQQRRLRIPLDWFVWLSLTDLQSRFSDTQPTSIAAEALKSRTVGMIAAKGLNSRTVFEQFGDGADGVFESVVGVGGHGVALAPVASVVGGVLSQDILNSIGGREEPVVNWLFLSVDASGATNVVRIGDVANPVVVD